MKSRIFAPLALALATTGLTACGSGGEPAAEASPDGKPGVLVTNGRLVLPAVKGNPGAVYFDIAFEGEGSAMIRGVEVLGAGGAMLHKSLSDEYVASMEEVLQVGVVAGENVSFEPGGYHVMAMELDDSLEAGGSTEVTLTFAGGDKSSFPVDIRAAGDAE